MAALEAAILPAPKPLAHNVSCAAPKTHWKLAQLPQYQSSQV